MEWRKNLFLLSQERQREVKQQNLNWSSVDLISYDDNRNAKLASVTRIILVEEKISRLENQNLKANDGSLTLTRNIAFYPLFVFINWILEN